jgi:hypothetical protein
MGYVTAKRRFLQEPHGVTSQKTPFFIVTAVETSNLSVMLLSRKPGNSVLEACLISGGQSPASNGGYPNSSPGQVI